jgi:hypothetical protein
MPRPKTGTAFFIFYHSDLAKKVIQSYNQDKFTSATFSGNTINDEPTAVYKTRIARGGASLCMHSRACSNISNPCRTAHARRA